MTNSIPSKIDSIHNLSADRTERRRTRRWSPARQTLATIALALVFISTAGPGGCNSSDLAALTAGLGVGSSVKIQSYFPVSNPVNLAYSGAAQSFIVSASSPLAGALITYTWRLDGSQIWSDITGSLSFNPATYGAGTKTLIVTASDGVTSDTKSWTVRVNRPPTISSPSPSATKGLSEGSTLALSATVSDPDGDTLTTTWTIGGASSSYLVDNGVSGGTASATLTGYSGHAGQNTVTLSVSDGLQTATQTYTINVNYFHDGCNNLSQGQICTYVGAKTLGSGSSPTSSDVALSQISTFDFDSAGNVYFWNGYGYYMQGHLWFWNRSGATVTRNGVSIPSGKVAILAGAGGYGQNHSAMATTAFSGYITSGLASDLTTGDLILTSDTAGFGMLKLASGSTTLAAYNSTNGMSKLRYRNISGERRVYYYDITARYLKYVRLSDGAVTIVAGTGVNASTGNGGAATSAAVTDVYGQVAFDSNDNIYIPEYGSGSIRIICTTTATGICSGANKVNGTGDLLVDSSGTTTATAGNIYRLIGTGANALASTDNTSPLTTSIYYPTSVEVTAAGHVLFIDYHRIRAFNTSGGAATVAGVSIPSNKVKFIVGVGNTTGYGTDGTLASSSPTNFGCQSGTFNCSDVKIGPDGNIWYQENFTPDSIRYTSRLRTVDISTGIATTVVGSGSSFEGITYDSYAPARSRPSRWVFGVAAASDGTLFYNEGEGTGAPSLKYVSPTSGLVSNAGTRLTAPTPGLLFLSETGTYRLGFISIDSNDGLVLPEWSNSAVYYWNRQTSAAVTLGGVTTQAGRLYQLAGIWGSIGYSGSGLSATSSMIRYAYGAVANGGNVYIADYANSCVRKVDSSGVMTDFIGTCNAAGNGASGLAPTATAMNSVTSVAIDSLGNAAVCDFVNHKVRYFNLTGSPVTVFNQTIPANQGFTLTGGGADATSSGIASTSSLNGCAAVVFDSSGNLFFSDYTYNLVRRINRTGASAGTIDIVAGRRVAATYLGSIRSWDGTQEAISATSADITAPYGMAFDSSGDLYFAVYAPGGGIKKVKLSP